MITSKSQERNPLPGLSLPVAVQNLFQKMVVFLIVSNRRFLTALGGVV